MTLTFNECEIPPLRCAPVGMTWRDALVGMTWSAVSGNVVTRHDGDKLISMNKQAAPDFT